MIRLFAGSTKDASEGLYKVVNVVTLPIAAKNNETLANLGLKQCPKHHCGNVRAEAETELSGNNNEDATKLAKFTASVKGNAAALANQVKAPFNATKTANAMLSRYTNKQTNK